MPIASSKALRIALTAFGLLSPLAAHFILTSTLHVSRFTAYALILTQIVLVGGFAAAQLRPPYRRPALAAFAGCGAALIFLRVTGGLVLSSGLPHALIYLGLLAVFGHSLRPGQEPLVSFLARRIHGPLSAARSAYTRKVTLAWCLFFVFQLLGSAALLVLAPLSWWSAFVNLLNLPLVGLMFLAERLGRPLWLSDAPHENVDDMFRMVELMQGRVLHQNAKPR